VDDEESIRVILEKMFTAEGYEVVTASSGEAALVKYSGLSPDVVMLDQNLPGKLRGMDILKKMQEQDRRVPVIMLTGHGDVRMAVEAVKAGAYDFITKPFDPAALLLAVKRARHARQLMTEVQDLRGKLAQRGNLQRQLMGKSEAIQSVLRKIEKVAATDFTVLIQGASGTGKEVAAHAIHQAGHRRDCPFIHVDCGIIPENLIESELFGHEKGAFTGAVEAQEGQFELADKGTIFLDEIGNLPFHVQGKLLRILQSRTFRRVGGKADRQVDVRILAATNEDLGKAIKDRRFREDLYYRLGEFVIAVPPLSDRREDIPKLAGHFAGEAQTELGKQVKGFTDEALGLLAGHTWQGNVRELRNVVRNAVLMAHEWISPADLVLRNQTVLAAANVSSPVVATDERPLREIVRQVVAQIERDALAQRLEANHGNKSRTARSLDVDYKTLLNKLKVYGIGANGHDPQEKI
jgi:DNA-binding NtrC family response regulator